MASSTRNESTGTKGSTGNSNGSDNTKIGKSGDDGNNKKRKQSKMKKGKNNQTKISQIFPSGKDNKTPTRAGIKNQGITSTPTSGDQSAKISRIYPYSKSTGQVTQKAGNSNERRYLQVTYLLLF